MKEEIKEVLDTLWALKDGDKFYFDAYGEEMLKALEPHPQHNGGSEEELVDVNCMYCKESFKSEEPQMCCSGAGCGCMGMPTEPIVCSKGCYEMLLKEYNQEPVVYPSRQQLNTVLIKSFMSNCTTHISNKDGHESHRFTESQLSKFISNAVSETRKINK